jgi:hypothetical protein
LNWQTICFNCKPSDYFFAIYLESSNSKRLIKIPFSDSSTITLVGLSILYFLAIFIGIITVVDNFPEMKVCVISFSFSDITV